LQLFAFKIRSYVAFQCKRNTFVLKVLSFLFLIALRYRNKTIRKAFICKINTFGLKVFRIHFLTALQNKATLKHFIAKERRIVLKVLSFLFLIAFNVQKKITLRHITAKEKRIALRVLSLLFLIAFNVQKKITLRHITAFGALL
jgi:hypothetical protein